MAQFAALGREIRLQLRLLCRTGANLLLVLFLPLMSLIFIQTLNAGAQVLVPGSQRVWVSFVAYGTAGMVSLGIAVASFVSLTVGIATARERSVLKRIRGTPISPSVYLAGRVGASVAVGTLVMATVLCVSAVRYDLELEASQVPLLALCALVGAGAYAALGIAAAALVPNADAAHATAYGLLIPTMFASSIFHPPQFASDWLRTIGEALPLQPLTHAVFGVLVQSTDGSTVPWGDLATVAVWGVVGGVVGLLTFSWMPAQAPD